jgi:hypothetical protein
LLTTGLAIDAAVINHTSKELKQRVGPFAFDLAAAESLPEQHPFPIEVTVVGDGQDQPMSWNGEAYQVILGNTRRYANAVELTPDALLDDGKLDLCVITEGNAITTLQQITSLLFRHRPDAMTARHFLAAHFLITVPASIHMHLDGSPVELEDSLRKSDREVLLQEQEREHVMVTGAAAIPNERHTSIIAGCTVKQRTGETRPVAVRIDDDTIVLLQTGERVPLAHVQKLQDGAVVVAHGKKSKRGVIKAEHVILPDS